MKGISMTISTCSSSVTCGILLFLLSISDLRSDEVKPFNPSKDFSESHVSASNRIAEFGGYVTTAFDPDGSWYTVIHWRGNRFSRVHIPKGEFLPIAKLDRVKVVILDDDSLTNDEFKCVANLPRLKVLRVSSKQVDNHCLRILRTLPSIETCEFNCPKIKITDDDLIHFKGISSLHTLIILNSGGITHQASVNLSDFAPACRTIYFPEGSAVGD